MKFISTIPLDGWAEDPPAPQPVVQEDADDAKTTTVSQDRKPSE